MIRPFLICNMSSDNNATTLIRAGQFAQAARQGGIILIALSLPRLGIGRDVIGVWENLLYLGYILGFGWMTGLLQAFLVRIRLTRPQAADRFSRIAILSVGVFSLLLLTIAAGLHEPLFRLLRLGDAPPGWGYFFLFLLTQWPGLFFEQILTIRGKAWPLAIFGGLSSLGLVLALLMPLFYGLTLPHALFILACFAGVKGVVILGWLLYDHLNDQTIKTVSKQEKEQLSPWLKAAWPLMIYATVSALVTAFDPWFVNYWYDGDEDVFAVFRYGARELPLLAAFTNGAMVVVLPRLTEAPSAGLDLLKESSRRLMHWIFGGAILLMVTAPWWWTLVFTEMFAESRPLFQAYLFVVASRLLFPVPVLTAMGHTRMLMVFGLLELVLNVLISILLVPHFGLMGIIWATVLAYLIDKVCLMYYLRYRTGIPPKRYTDFRWYGGYLAVMLVAYLLMSR
ncbi:MAG: O-antigen/teichoic acid export membrane protein [Neolewinella sp.]|jgi:O-antigen/teichoic acid export membrane protein